MNMSKNKSLSDEGYNNPKVNNAPRSLLDLYWLDILSSQILSRLPLKSLFNLRCVSKDLKKVVDLHFQNMKHLKINRKNFPMESFKVFFICENITSIDLENCESITDDYLIPLLNKNKRIVCVNFGRCYNLTAKSLQPLILQCNIKDLRLMNCTWITTGALEALVLHQSSLEMVNFSFCDFSSDNILVMFLKKFNKLKILLLKCVPQMNNNCLYIISHFLELTHLYIDGCKSVSDEGINFLISGCPKLKYVGLRGCDNVSKRSYDKLNQRNVKFDYMMRIRLTFG